MKEDIGKSVLTPIDEESSFTLETDASSSAIAGTLSQNGKPVAFFSRVLTNAEKKHPIIENEALAIVECVRKWKAFLGSRHFRLVTDQRALSFVFNNHGKGRIKNEKIERWRLELSPFSYDVSYRPGIDNIPADTLSRMHCAALPNLTNLQKLHDALVHPGVKRMLHFVRAKNLPYSVEEVRRVISDCTTCAKVKPQFYKPPEPRLIKATSPFERLSIDFKGPLPSSSLSNTYILTIVDEFSRFPFAYPCRDISASTVIKCLTQLFSIFGLPAYIHSDRGTSFMSSDLKRFLTDLGVSSSRTTPYNPRGNSQCERYNAVIWNSVRLAVESRKLKINAWEDVLPDALHSIRSLLCTSTNETPHERMFGYRRRTASGQSIPSWLCEPGPVLLKRHVRASKYDPAVEPVELIEANPHYAHVRFPNGREDTVATRDLAPIGAELVDGGEPLQGAEVESREAAAPDPDAECQPRTTPLPETTPLSELSLIHI